MGKFDIYQTEAERMHQEREESEFEAKFRGKKPFQKQKPYVILQYLLRYSDKNHAKSYTQIEDFLEKHGIYAERRSVYRDIQDINCVLWMLGEEDLDPTNMEKAQEWLESAEEDELFVVYDKHQKGYYVNRRKYDPEDIRMLMECVYSAKFLSAHDVDRLIDALADFVSVGEAEIVREKALQSNQVRSKDSHLLENLKTINDAMRKTSGHDPEKITFKYLSHSIDSPNKQQPRRNGKLYIVSPYRMLISNGYYYLIGYDDEKKKMLTYRVDRMGIIKRTGEPRENTPAADEFIPDEKPFTMIGKKMQRVKIQFIHSLLDTVLDLFPTSEAVYQKIDEEHFAVTVNVKVSDQFFAWVSGFGRRAKILSPDSVVEQYKEFLDKIREIY